MAYGEIKIDTITFTDGGIDKSVSISGLVQNPTFSGNITVTGTISGNTLRGQTVSGVTVTGTTAQFASGTFTSLTGTTLQGTTASFTTGTFTSLTGTTLQGTTATYTTGSFTSLTGTTTQGTTASFTTGTFTSLTGTTTTGTTATFTTGVFSSSISGAVITATSGVIASGTAANPSLSILGDPNTGIYSPGADQVAISSNGVQRINIEADGDINIDSGGVFYDATNNRLAIGNTSPSAILDVKVASDAKVLVQDGNTTGNVKFNAVNNAVSANVNLEISASNTQFFNGGSERARIDSSGTFRVKGAGTAGVNDAVQLNGSAPANSLLLDASGRVLVGTSSAMETFGGTLLQVANVAGATAVLGREDSTVVADDALGSIYFNTYAGSSWQESATIRCFADANQGSGDVPSRLVFSVTADGASSPTEAMRIKNSRIINIANTPVYADNAAAKTGGLVDGDVYRTSTGDLKIVYT